jgi:hypothetical protein
MSFGSIKKEIFGVNLITPFLVSLTNKLECLSLATLSALVL